MDGVDPEYTLRWPRTLFVWESKRLICHSDNLRESLSLLLEEAFEEKDASEQFDRATATIRIDGWGDPQFAPPAIEPKDWIERLLINEEVLNPNVATPLWAERNGLVPSIEKARSNLVSGFAALVCELQSSGYFPRVLPKPCVDDRGDQSAEALKVSIKRVTQLAIEWPIADADKAGYPDESLYTLIEYFHDQAQRPRSRGYIHSFCDCGPHFSNWNKDSGGTVYRWRVNELLSIHGVPLRLSSSAGERGRLVIRVAHGADDLIQKQLARRNALGDEVAHAMRDFRSRNAGRPQKIAALSLLAGELESRRTSVKAELLSRDEGALFDIANNYAIRHRNAQQRADYGEEFIAWIFVLFVNTIELLDGLAERGADGSSAVAGN